MTGSAISKILPIYYNDLTEGKIINEAKEEAERFNMSLSAFVKYLMKDSILVTSNIHSEINIDHRKIREHEAREASKNPKNLKESKNQKK